MPPVPKRNAERRRRNLESRADVAKRSGSVPVPPASRGLHPVAHRWYAALARSGQSDYFEPSDWAAALYVAEAITVNLASVKFSAQLFAVVWAAMQDLLTTEQARRRARIEVERDIADQENRPGVTVIDEYRKALG
jgi:hypothetical protein